MRLERQMQHEMARTSAQRMKALEYDKKELSVTIETRELMALTACMREVKRVLGDPSTKDRDDAIDKAVHELLDSLQDYGMVAPPMLRISHNEYLIGSEVVQCAMQGGRLHVRPPVTSALASPTLGGGALLTAGSAQSPRTSPVSSPVLRSRPMLPSSSPRARFTDFVPIGEYLRSRATRVQGIGSARIPFAPSSPSSQAVQGHIETSRSLSPLAWHR